MQRWFWERNLKGCPKYFFLTAEIKSHKKRLSEHSGDIFVLKYLYLETEMPGGAGDAVTWEASSPKRPLPLPNAASAAARVPEHASAWLGRSLCRCSFNIGYFISGLFGGGCYYFYSANTSPKMGGEKVILMLCWTMLPQLSVLNQGTDAEETAVNPMVI